jgi:hypothetical protein
MGELSAAQETQSRAGQIETDRRGRPGQKIGVLNGARNDDRHGADLPVESHNFAHLLDKQGIGRQFDRLCAMREAASQFQLKMG